VLDDNPADDDPDLLNYVVVVYWIACWMSSLLPMYWPNLGKLDGPVFMLPDTGPAVPVLDHEDVEGGLWTFRFDHPQRPLLSYDNLSHPGLRPNRVLIVCVSRDQVYT
jgi:hypothetical protein